VLSSENHNGENGKVEQLALMPELANGNPKWQREFFDQRFWPIRWRNDGKKTARDYFDRKVKNIAHAERILKAAIEQRPQYLKRDESNRPYMTTWLNQERFDDELQSAVCPEPRRRIL
jgi:hypothetical protein